MEQLQYDPRSKQLIKDVLYDFLYDPVIKHFQKRLDVLLVKNTLLGGYSHKSFSYKGVLYSTDIGAPPRKANRLVPQLKKAMDEYLEDLKNVNEREIPFVIGFINQVLNASNNLNDYIRILPDSVHHPLQKMLSKCPCQDKKLNDDLVAQIQQKNKASIDMMKARMVTNLLI
jgi:hypothetical protein